jgi:hypothetical protein
MDYLQVAEKSAHPEIRQAALKIAKQTSKYERRQKARVSPNLILALGITLGISVVLACWYAFLHYPGRIAYVLSSISILLYLVIIGISLLLSGHLTQANFMKILGWLASHVRAGWNSVKSIWSPQNQGPSDKDSI